MDLLFKIKPLALCLVKLHLLLFQTLVTGDGEAANFRGLSYYTLKTSAKSQLDLFLVTLDISTPGEGVFLKVIDLNSPTQTGRR